MKAKREFGCFTLPPQALTRAGFKGISQPSKQIYFALKAPLANKNSKDIIPRTYNSSRLKIDDPNTCTSYALPNYTTICKNLSRSQIESRVNMAS